MSESEVVAAVEAVLAEVRAVRLEMKERDVLVDLGAVSYLKAAAMLDVHVSELKAMIRASVILSVKYADKKRPKVPLSEIRRLTTPKLALVAKPRGKPSKRRKAGEVMSPEELALRAKAL